MTKLFLSYRRADSRVFVDRLYEYLAREFGASNVFKDVNTIRLAEDFRAAIERSIILSDVVLVVIGKQWASITDEAGNRRLDDSADFVRQEVEMALRHARMVVPLLADGARMPTSDEIPASLGQLIFKNAAAVRDANFEQDMAQLCAAIRQEFPEAAKSPRPKISPRIIGTIIGVVILIAVVGVVLSQLPPQNQSSPSNTPSSNVLASSTITGASSSTPSATTLTLTNIQPAPTTRPQPTQASASATPQQPTATFVWTPNPDLPQTYSLFDGSLKFDYPANWVTSFKSPMIILASSQATLTGFLANETVPDQQQLITVDPLAKSGQNSDVQLIADASAQLVIANGGSIQNSEVITLAGREAALVTIRLSTQSIEILVVKLDAKQIVTLTSYTTQNSATASDILRAVAETLSR